MKKLKKYVPVLLGVVACLLAGVIGSYFTMPAIPAWYQGLKKAPFNPPAYVFGPAWTTLYTLMGIAVGLIWQKGLKNKKVKPALYVFAVQLALNILWSIAFFGMRSPLAGVVVIVCLWFAIIETIRRFYPLNKAAAWLLAPYICWVSFAAVLNAAVWILNR